MPPGAGRALRQVMKDLRSPNRSPARRRAEPPEYDDEWEDDEVAGPAGTGGVAAPGVSTRPPAQQQQQQRGGRNGAYSGAGGGNPRAFPHAVKVACWNKAETVPGRDPDRWRRDAAGNVVFRQLVACKGCLCYDYDHVVPYSKVCAVEAFIPRRRWAERTEMGKGGGAEPSTLPSAPYGGKSTLDNCQVLQASEWPLLSSVF
ncbi:unnamed protein product [Closterium sp. Naga37s-1]|nr:unnamed protein product [Closterium sp. Naga37s-1]